MLAREGRTLDQLGAIRALFAASLGFHIVFATLGVGMPLMIAIAEIAALRRRDATYRRIAHRWAAAFSVLLGTGVVSGTIVALQLQLLWPGFMRLVGEIIALPFAIEVVAFFIEAVFTAIYLYAGDRIRPGLRILTALLVAFGAALSAMLITDVNAFMNTPTGFHLQGGQLIDVQPWRAMLNPAMPTELSHVLATAYLTVALVLAAFAAAGSLRARSQAEHAYRRRELALSTGIAAVMAVLTAITGDLSGKFLASQQPIKLAAAEGLFQTSAGAPLTVGGIADPATAQIHGGLALPGLLSWLATGSTHGRVLGLLDFPRSLWPPVTATHLLFDGMVAIGILGLVASAAYLIWRWRHPAATARPPAWLMRALIVMGPAAMAGIEAGWVFAELARQPWTVTGVLTTAEAVTRAPGAGAFLIPFLLLYAVLAAGAVVALRAQMRRQPPAEAPGGTPPPRHPAAPAALHGSAGRTPARVVAQP
jgi:cytochrome d ubiquinol oxidase subunit I